MSRTHIDMQRLVDIIERIGLPYNLKLNYAKCKLLVLHDLGGQVRFGDGSEAQKEVNMLTYLAALSSNKLDHARIVQQVIGYAYRELQRLKLFWCASNCSVAWKVIVFNAQSPYASLL
eukprot:4504977-Amphidinium_carterae.2